MTPASQQLSTFNVYSMQLTAHSPSDFIVVLQIRRGASINEGNQGHVDIIDFTDDDYQLINLSQGHNNIKVTEG
jgi:hypothetical protein